MDLYDAADSPNVYAMLEIPGISPDNISVQVYQGKLVVTGIRGSPLLEHLLRSKTDSGHNQRASHPPNSSFRARELKYGRFHREISLPEHCSVSNFIRYHTSEY